MSHQPVFFDPEGTRRKRASLWAVVLGLIVAVLTTTLLVSFFVVPLLPRIAGITGTSRKSKYLIPKLPNADKRRVEFLAAKARTDLDRQIENDKKRHELAKANAKKPPPGSAIVAAFYSPEEEFGIGSFRDHAQDLTHVFPVWLAIDRNDPGRLDLSGYNIKPTELGLKAPGQELIDLARRNGVHIWPVLSNLYSNVFDKAVVTQLLDSPEKQTALAAAIRDWLKRNGFEGLNLDFESLATADYVRLQSFLTILQSTLRVDNLGLSIDLEAELDAPTIGRLAKNVDLVIAMAYDEHAQDGDAGPIASANWVEGALDKFSSVVPANKLVAGVGSYAYDWGQKGKVASNLPYQGALKTAEDYRDGEEPDAVLDLDDDSLNTHFAYDDEDDIHHQVWILDGVSAFNEWKLARDKDARGTALWLLGDEDPSIWRFLNKDAITQEPDPKVLETVEFGPDDLETVGEGDLLFAKGERKDASRTIELDPKTGLVDGQVYHGYPSGYYLQKKGYIGPKILALTFDDGPDPANTPEILDVLKEYKAPAAFFVIGQNAEKNPDLVRRMYDEGHEIGSHTFNHPNLDDVSDQRVNLELNATQRAIQGITGRTTALFRPPYNADSTPSKPEDMRAILIASNLGYITVGESIDPQDWRRHENVDDTGALRGPEEIVDAVLYQLSEPGHGNVILLHDGGGDRTTTIAALKKLIPKLRDKGYSFVSISALLKSNRNAVMPPISIKDRALIGIDQVAFTSLFTFEWLLRFAFLVAVALGLARVVIITPLAIAHNRRKQPIAPGFRPSVSVMIAAFNEEKVIQRTISAILASDYPVGEVIVVDDGSADSTFLELVTKFAGDLRVIALKQENGGKASALNRALSQARGEVLVCIDADTQLAPDAISRLVPHFADRQIAAVAGNVKVGNRVNLITRWQSVEYITSQNLDRKAYAQLNGISVCPGAIGAWRRTALVEAGGYVSDTLAEDMDLTWRLRRSGWKVETENNAVAYTEAPDTLRGFLTQRFRWSYGTLQCLWKHRRALGKHGWFGWVTLPTLWLFQIVFQVLAPLVDLQVVFTTLLFTIAWISSSQYTGDWRPSAEVQQSLVAVVFLSGLFFTVELISGFIAYRMDRERARELWWLFLQRFVYRQIMYAVIFKSILAAIRGRRQGWGKLERKATVEVR